MKVRLLTSLGIAVFGLPLLIFSQYIVYPIALGLLSTIAVWELLRVFGMHKRVLLAIPTYLLSALLPFFSYGLFFPSEKQSTYLLIIALAIFAYLIFLAGYSVLSNGRVRFIDIAKVFAAVTYVTVSFTSMSLLRYMDNGAYVFGLIFVGAWVSDSFAYFTGRLIGRHKLAPELSPKKTVEGSIGGIVFTVIAFAVYGIIIECFFSLDANYLALCLTGLALSLVGQIGDLFASLIKREHGVKDYSGILPGHGGIMDRFDSVLAVSPVLLIISILFPLFAI